MSIREAVAGALVAGLDDRYAIYGYPRDPEFIPPKVRPVCVWTDAYTRGKTFRHVGVTVVVWVLTGRTAEDDDTEDELEDALSEVLAVLDAATTAGQTFVWTTATRGLLEDRWHGYRIELSAVGRLIP